MRVLDLDLDFFVSPIENWKSGKDRLSEDEFSVEPLDSIRAFLEKTCHLDRHHPTPGRLLEEHVEAFEVLRELSKSSGGPASIDLDHVDAHSDLDGGMTSTWSYLFTKYLHLPNDERAKRATADGRMNSGNFLVFAAACGWLRHLSFIHPPEWKDDIMHYYVKDFYYRSGYIQLRRIHKADLDAAGIMAPIEKVAHQMEPPIPFTVLPRAHFAPKAPYDFVLLTRSPGFTPKSADAAYDMIAEYLKT